MDGYGEELVSIYVQQQQQKELTSEARREIYDDSIVKFETKRTTSRSVW